MKSVTITMPFLARISAVAITDAQRGDLGLMRTLADVAKKIELTPEEREAIKFQYVVLPGGEEAPAWDADAKLADRAFQLEPEEARRLRQVLKACDRYSKKDLEWAEPLLAQLEV